MTAQTPAPPAGGLSSLLAALSKVPPPPSPDRETSANKDFLEVIEQALKSPSSAADRAADKTGDKPGQEKPAPAEAPAPNPIDASQLLAMLIPPLPILIETGPHRIEFPTLPITQAGGTHKNGSSAAKTTGKSDSDAAAKTKTTTDQIAASASLSQRERAGVRERGTTTDQTGTSAPSQPTSASSENKPHKTVAEPKIPPLPAYARAFKTSDDKPSPTSGTSVANTSQRMNLMSQRNEIAGRIEQKLPPEAVSALSSPNPDGSSPDHGSKTPLPFSWHDAPSEAVTIIDLSGKAGATTPTAQMAEEGPLRAVSTAPMQRLEQMISNEVLSFRQTGAQTLGVSLKLDANTELFLQLTTNNGTVQATMRCERGNFSPDQSAWTQLQQSLAGQNVELLPMSGGSNLGFQHPSQNHREQRSLPEDGSAPNTAVQPAQQRKQKEQNRSRNNWESWA